MMSFFEKLFGKKSRVIFNEPAGWKKNVGVSTNYFHPADELTNITYVPPKKIWKGFKLGDWSKQIDADKDAYGDIKVIKQGVFQTAGLDASDLIHEYKVDADIFKTRSVVIIKNEKYILFYLNTTPKEFDNNNRTLNNLLKSIQWED